MAITADDLQAMVTHWLGTPPNGYLGSGYGSGVRDILQQPMSAGGADALIAKLRSDIAIMGELPQEALNLYSTPSPPDRVDLFFEVAGNFIRLDADGSARPADL
jgi:hypothetical protein